jgi:putative transposase
LAECVCGTLDRQYRRDCLKHFIVLDERQLKRIVTRDFIYYQGWRTHLSLGTDSLEARAAQLTAHGTVVEIPEVVGLHHHYERLTA